VRILVNSLRKALTEPSISFCKWVKTASFIAFLR
jgi:hypothetical protein